MGTVGIDQWIDKIGVTIYEAYCPDGWWGFYDPEAHAIVLRPDLAPVQRLSTLAHELGHAYYRHEGTTARQEREAAEWAAAALIEPSEFESATRCFEAVVAVANELQVLPRDVRNFASMCQKKRADIVSSPTQDAIFQAN